MFSWTKGERDRLHIQDNCTATCSMGIWNTQLSPKLNSQLPEILKKERKDTCFFIEFHEGMSFPAARDLQKLRYENRNLKRSYRYTQIGLWIASISLAANLIYSIFRD